MYSVSYEMLGVPKWNYPTHAVQDWIYYISYNILGAWNLVLFTPAV